MTKSMNRNICLLVACAVACAALWLDPADGSRHYVPEVRRP